MADLAYLNSADGIARLRSFFESEFLARVDRLLALSEARVAQPAPAEILHALGCSRDELAAFFSIIHAKARGDGQVMEFEAFGIEIDVTAVLHHDRAAGVTHWILKPWSREGLMPA